MKFDYPLENSYYFDSSEVKSIKQKVSGVRGILNSHEFFEVKLPFLVSPLLIEPFESEYNHENLVEVFPGGSRSKRSYLPPYMFFIQASPLIKTKDLSYKNLPLFLYDTAPAYKRLVKSSSDPFCQTEEIFSFQGGGFMVEALESNQVETRLKDVLEDVFTSLKIDFTTSQEKLFYLTESTVFRNSDGIFLGGFHELSKNLAEVGLFIKNPNNEYVSLKLISFAISQNLLLL